ncbi:MAG: 16S rRNA G966 N2-methylase RsmD [Algoriphagus sp.]|jgi:16S rRNA G966 N2-methylase RsmD
MNLEKILAANQEARKLGKIDIQDFALRNIFKWSNEFLKDVLNQYQILQKMRKKLPTWFENNEVIAASLLNMEQCTSETIANYKFNGLKGKIAVDLTGGFGVDTYHLTKKFDSVIYCETNDSLLEIVKHNFNVLGVKNVYFKNIQAEEFLAKTDLQFDLIYLDPDRRNKINKKLVFLDNLSPNLLDINQLILNKAEKILIKLSPILDIAKAASQLIGLQSVEILAQKNEVKELVFTLESKIRDKSPVINSTHIQNERIDTFSFCLNDETKAIAQYSEPKKYLYEANAAIMKSGGFKLISLRFGLTKIARHSHYYTSDDLISNFQGKIFQVNRVYNFNSLVMKSFRNMHFNILSRNFPLNPVTIAKKYHLNVGGELFLIFTQNYKNEKIILSCVRSI